MNIINRYVSIENNSVYFENKGKKRLIGLIINDSDLYINYKDYQLKNVWSINFQENFKFNVITCKDINKKTILNLKQVKGD